MRDLLYRFNPAVPQRWLVLLAGVVWTSVGTFLCYRALSWVVVDAPSAVFIASGAAVGVAGNRFIFTRVAQQNLARISLLPMRACIFAFTAWRGYAMICAMITIGIFLRTSSIPKQYLATLYTAMGGALFLASFEFYRSYWRSFSKTRNARTS
jgi:hypothetical protein